MLETIEARSQESQWSLILSCVFIFKIVRSELLGSLSLILKYIFPTVPCSGQLAEYSAGLITARRSDETVSALKTLLARSRPSGTYDRFKER